MSKPLLEATGVHRRFGGVHAVDDMHIDVAAGELVGLIGPNGAGKSTFFDCLSGFTAKDEGSVRFDGKDISRARRYQVARAGLVRTFQATSALERMSVRDNLRLAPRQTGERFWNSLTRPDAAQAAGIERRVEDALAFFSLDEVADKLGGDLSGGQKKLLDLARAMLAEPKMLLLDEPLAGVNPTLRAQIMERIEALVERGVTCLMIEHDMTSVFGHCDRVVVMAEGRFLMAGTPDEVRRDARVREAYLGD